MIENPHDQEGQEADLVFKHKWLAHPSRCHLLGSFTAIVMITSALALHTLLSSWSKPVAVKADVEPEASVSVSGRSEINSTIDRAVAVKAARMQLVTQVQSIHEWLPAKLYAPSVRAEIQRLAAGAGLDVIDLRVIESTDEGELFGSITLEVEAKGSREASYRFVETAASATQPLHCIRLRTVNEREETSLTKFRLIGFFGKPFEWENREEESEEPTA